MTDEEKLGSPEDALLSSFFAAIEAGDFIAVSDLYASDVAVWHNVTRVSLDKVRSIALLQTVRSRVADMRYEILERWTVPGHAVQRHVLHGTTPSGPIAANVCITFDFEAGVITRIHEYLDPADVAAVFASKS